MKRSLSCCLGLLVALVTLPGVLASPLARFEGSYSGQAIGAIRATVSVSVSHQGLISGSASDRQYQVTLSGCIKNTRGQMEGSVLQFGRAVGTFSGTVLANGMMGTIKVSNKTAKFLLRKEVYRRGQSSTPDTGQGGGAPGTLQGRTVDISGVGLAVFGDSTVSIPEQGQTLSLAYTYVKTGSSTAVLVITYPDYVEVVNLQFTSPNGGTWSTSEKTGSFSMP